ncbi:IS3 family transposase [Virgibacillus sp. 179-BFC.A HS]|uniref:IS3 family transposase n=3 Tax=Bacillaceae TaxID=186817 RepID=A0ABU5CJY2_9BACI|nr:MULTISPECIES: IS3 family transposase [Bacillaceae]MDY0406672.1 IS3 family transposase [Virgibacillus sp. 179-BFC.A HS]WHY80671.1 IS3 family transposase [Siminovitchia fortis]
MSKKNNGKRYNDDFRKMIVDLYHSGSSVKDLSSEYGISEVSIYAWIKKFSPIELEDGSSVTPDDYAKLQKQLLRIQEENEIFKKGYGHIRSKVSDSELTEFITEHKDDYSIRTMCETLDIPKSTYYQSLNKTESNRDRENREFTEKIIQIHEESKKRYGAPKIHETLEKQGHKISLKRVQRLMKVADIRSIIVKKFRPTPSKEKVEERENIINRDFSTTTINQKWVGDITYIHTLRDGWCYLASVLDLHSRKVIGYSFGRSMTTELVEKALENAYVTQKPNDGVIFHSDLGSQYTSDSFAEKIQDYKMTHSFSHKGSPYDNACIESFHAILKKEEVNHVQYLDFNAARVELFKYIEGWYNRKRIHGSIGYLTPQEMEDLALHQAA